MATYSNIFIDQGSTFTKTFSPPFVLIGYTAAGTIRKTYSSSPASASFSIKGDASGLPKIDNSPFTSSDKRLVISLTAAQTSALKAGSHVYDIELRKEDLSLAHAITVRVLEGQAIVTPRVTRSFE